MREEFLSIASHELISEQLDKAGCAVRVQGETRLTGYWDRYRLEQVVTHLLTNAMKYGRGELLVAS